MTENNEKVYWLHNKGTYNTPTTKKPSRKMWISIIGLFLLLLFASFICSWLLNFSKYLLPSNHEMYNAPTIEEATPEEESNEIGSVGEVIDDNQQVNITSNVLNLDIPVISTVTDMISGYATISLPDSLDSYSIKHNYLIAETASDLYFFIETHDYSGKYKTPEDYIGLISEQYSEICDSKDISYNELLNNNEYYIISYEDKTSENYVICKFSNNIIVTYTIGYAIGNENAKSQFEIFVNQLVNENAIA